MATAPATDGKRDVRAEAKWVRTSARKARLAIEHIRGRSVPEARTVLAFTDRAAAREVEKVLRSAVANAEANHGLVGDDLLVSGAYVDEGPTLKRWRARARGRAARIRKRTCHITVTLAPQPEERKRRASGAGAEARAKRAPRRVPGKAKAPSAQGADAAEEKPARQDPPEQEAATPEKPRRRPLRRKDAS